MCQIGPKSLVFLILWNQRAGRRDWRGFLAAWLKVSSLVDSGRRTMASSLIKRSKYGFLKDIEGGKDNSRVPRKGEPCRAAAGGRTYRNNDTPMNNMCESMPGF